MRYRSDELEHTGADVWWLFALVGLVSLIAGVILIAEPSHSLNALAVVFGIFLLFDGIVAILSSLQDGTNNRGLHSLLGVLGVLAGIILVRHPAHAVNAIGLLMGLWLVAAGVIRLLLARMRPLSLALAVLEIVVGIIIVSNPHIGYTTLAVISGIWLILNAIGLIGVSFMVRSVTREARTETAA